MLENDNKIISLADDTVMFYTAENWFELKIIVDQGIVEANIRYGNLGYSGVARTHLNSFKYAVSNLWPKREDITSAFISTSTGRRSFTYLGLLNINMKYKYEKRINSSMETEIKKVRLEKN